MKNCLEISNKAIREITFGKARTRELQKVGA